MLCACCPNLYMNAIYSVLLVLSKTALLNQIKRPLSDAGGFMIRGKFDKKTSPNTVVFSALDAFFGEINDGDDAAAAAQLKLRITETLGFGVG